MLLATSCCSNTYTHTRTHTCTHTHTHRTAPMHQCTQTRADALNGQRSACANQNPHAYIPSREPRHSPADIPSHLL